MRTDSTTEMNAVGSAVLPANTSMATGRPARSVSSPYSIWATRVAPRRQGVLGALDPRAREVEVGETRGVGRGPQVTLREGRLDPRLATPQPVHGAVDVVGGDVLECEVAFERGVGPPLGGRELGTRVHHARQNERVGDIALTTRGSEQVR